MIRKCIGDMLLQQCTIPHAQKNFDALYCYSFAHEPMYFAFFLTDNPRGLGAYIKCVLMFLINV